MPRRRSLARVVAALAALATLTACDPATQDEPAAAPSPSHDAEPEMVTLAFVGDVHFENQLAGLYDRPRSSLGELSRHLRHADLAMANLESALTTSGQPTMKELEDPSLRYWFRAPPRALGVLARSGVDVVTVANNHGADYGVEGLRETLATARDAPVAVVGVGRTAAQAFRPHRVTVRGVDIAVLAADAAFRESASPLWAAGEGGPGIASARGTPPARLVAAVRKAARRDDVVVVYLHWGSSGQECPTEQQRRLAEALAEAGADVVVGSHAHVLLGAGRLDDTYVAYGLGNFLWYHGAQPRTGVLKLRVRDGQVVRDELVPGRIPPAGGQPRSVKGRAGSDAEADWRWLRACAGLAPVSEQQEDAVVDDLPAFESEVRQIGPALRRRMRSSHDPAVCPVALSDLRYLRLSHVGFDGRRHTGELVVRADLARDVVGVFRQLYDARWPIRRMRLVDDYGGDDDRAMAADNTSAYNCRRVAGQTTWSAHAFGAAIDINPVENPYLVGGEVRPPAGRRFAAVDRSPGTDARPGVIREGDVVTTAFARIGWTWGGDFAEPDYQHFTAR